MLLFSNGWKDSGDALQPVVSTLKRLKQVYWGTSFLFGRWGDATLAWDTLHSSACGKVESNNEMAGYDNPQMSLASSSKINEFAPVNLSMGSA
jgi:hypothetical protein